MSSSVAGARRAEIRRALASRTPARIEPAPRDRLAAVTLILTRRGPETAALFVRRAEWAGDPWSGHTALPGGTLDPGDADVLDAAIREVREEVGIPLSPERYLGRLDDIRPASRTPSVVVSPFVAWAPREAEVIRNAEIQGHDWVPLSALVDPRREGSVEYRGSGAVRRFPSIEYGEFTIWGLTYRVVRDFLSVTAGIDSVTVSIDSSDGEAPPDE